AHPSLLPRLLPSAPTSPSPPERTPLEIEDEALAAAGKPTSTTLPPLDIPRSTSWKQHIISWTEADPAAGLDWPLCDWRESWLNKAAPKLVSNYAVRSTFQKAYINVGRDDAAFNAKFSAAKGYTEKVGLVLKNIRAVLIAEGVLTGRDTKQKRAARGELP
ncbi:hypothetical protein P7C70_g6717, partial [Phenoliferia sp. Uapishka_3]